MGATLMLVDPCSGPQRASASHHGRIAGQNLLSPASLLQCQGLSGTTVVSWIYDLPKSVINPIVMLENWEHVQYSHLPTVDELSHDYCILP